MGQSKKGLTCFFLTDRQFMPRVTVTSMGWGVGPTIWITRLYHSLRWLCGNSGLEMRFWAKTAVLFAASGDVGLDHTLAYLYSR